MNVNEWINQGKTSGWLIEIKGKLRLTGKLEEETKIARVIPNSTSSTLPSRPISVAPITKSPEEQKKDLYKRFIKESNVPRESTNSNGDRWWTNTYSKAGADEFFKILSKGYKYEILVLATKLYYYKTKTNAVAIGNFITKDIWIGFYDEVENAMKEGKLGDYVKEETKSNFGDDI